MKDKRFFPKMSICWLICFFVFCNAYINVSATEYSEVPYIVLESYSLTDEKVVPGQDFTLSFVLTNHSENVTAKDILIDVMNPNGVAPVYGTVSQIWIPEILPNSSERIEVDYTCSADIVSEYLDFYVSISGGSTGYAVLRVPVGSDVPFNILAVSMPDEKNYGDGLTASVSFKVIGEENVRNVYIELIKDDIPVAKSTIGSLTPGVTRTQNISAMAEGSGVSHIQLVLGYDDELGQTKEHILGTTDVTFESIVYEEDTIQGNPSDSESTNEDINKMLILGVGGMFLLIIFFGVFILIKRNN